MRMLDKNQYNSLLNNVTHMLDRNQHPSLLNNVIHCRSKDFTYELQ